MSQGRCKPFLLDDEARGSVFHSSHLNPVRAGLAKISELQTYADSSFAQIGYPHRCLVQENMENWTDPFCLFPARPIVKYPE